MKNASKREKIIGGIIILIPFVMGFIGFMMAYKTNYIVDDSDPFRPGDGHEIEHALFDAFGQYFFNRDKGGHMNWLITVSQFMAPLCLISGLMFFVGGWTRRLSDQIVSRLRKETVAVYGDHEGSKAIAESDKNCLYREDKLLKKPARHIIFFQDEMDSLEFYKENRKWLKDKDVHIVLETADPFVFADDPEKKGGIALDHISFVNINELLARRFWKEHNLLKYYGKNDMPVKIAIVGSGELEQKILNYGIMLNLYQADQHIEYHLWGDWKTYRNYYGNLNQKLKDGAAADEVTYHEENWSEDIHSLKTMDRIILGSCCDRDYVQRVITICGGAEIFFWDPAKTMLQTLWGESVNSYGSRSDMTAKQVIHDAQHSAAKAMNARYELIYGASAEYARDGVAWRNWVDEKWSGLSHFTRESNEIAAEYHTLREMILKKDEEFGKAIDEGYINNLCVLEHMRWSRFHYMNAWEHGAGEDGKKDPKLRLHPDLIPYSDLSAHEQGKDLEAIAILIYDPALRRDKDAEDYISDDRRCEIIRQMAVEKFEEEAEKYWTDLLGKLDNSDSKIFRIAFTMYDIHDIAYLKKGRELLGDRLQASVWGYDHGLENVLPGEHEKGTVFTFDVSPDESELEEFDAVI